MKKVILASASPWRRKILESTGISFTVEHSRYEEDMTLKLSPRSLAVHLAREKAKEVAQRHKNAIIIGADTLVALCGKVIGKPGSVARARAILKRLSGKEHLLITGFVILDTKTGHECARAIQTRVKVRKLTEREIRRYAATKESQNAAGGYAIQGKVRGMLIESISGDYLNIVGLPLAEVVKELKKFGVKIPSA